MSEGVFINCPFDRRYTKKFRAIVFTISYCGLDPRCALEIADGSQNRLEKIIEIISDCRYAIHDISRVQLSAGLPRFNMPFEVGLFFGAKTFGGPRHSKKNCLVLDSMPFRYQRTLSDISGQDIQAHKDDYREVIVLVRNWLAQFNKGVLLPGDLPISQNFDRFIQAFPRICRRAGVTSNRLPFNDFVNIVEIWIAKKGLIV
jgi:hypothetical protein